MGAGRASQWLVVAVGVDDQFADEFAGGGVDDADVRVLEQHEDEGPGVLGPGPMWWSFPPTRRVSFPAGPKVPR